MNENQKETFVSWLNDAYAMEQGIVENLERQLDHFESMPEMKKSIQDHIEASKGHAEKIKVCIESLDEEVSTAKSAIGNIVGAMQGMSTALADDQMVKDAIANFATEHFEIASYTALATTARELGEDHIAEVCEEIMQDEQEMADLLERNLPLVTTSYLNSRDV